MRPRGNTQATFRAPMVMAYSSAIEDAMSLWLSYGGHLHVNKMLNNIGTFMELPESRAQLPWVSCSSSVSPTVLCLQNT
jgi:hypothetical protein